MKKKLRVLSSVLIFISVIVFLRLLYYYFDSIAYCVNNPTCSFAAAELSYLGTIPVYIGVFGVFFLLLSYVLTDVREEK